MYSPIRILIAASPASPDARLLERVAGVLHSATERFPETFDYMKDQPNTVDHYGYHTIDLSATVLVKESWGNFYRLTIRPGEHEVFDNLVAIVWEHYYGS